MRPAILMPRKLDHGVDLAKELIGGVLELHQVCPQRMQAVRIHVLDQKLAIAFDGVERRPQIVTETAMESLEGFVFMAIRRRSANYTCHENVQLRAGTAHSVEVGKQ